MKRAAIAARPRKPRYTSGFREINLTLNCRLASRRPLSAAGNSRSSLPTRFTCRRLPCRARTALRICQHVHVKEYAAARVNVATRTQGLRQHEENFAVTACKQFC